MISFKACGHPPRTGEGGGKGISTFRYSYNYISAYGAVKLRVEIQRASIARKTPASCSRSVRTNHAALASACCAARPVFRKDAICAKTNAGRKQEKNSRTERYTFPSSCFSAFLSAFYNFCRQLARINSLAGKNRLDGKVGVSVQTIS